MNQLSSASSALRARLSRQTTFLIRDSFSVASSIDSASVCGERTNLNFHGANSVHNDVTINVSGSIFETCTCVLEKYPETILGNPIKRGRYWDSERKEYFVDAHAPSFEAIFQFLQTDKIKKPYEVPMDTFLENLELFELDSEILDMYKFGEGILPMEEEVELPPDEGIRRTLWEVFEVPSSSRAASVVAVCSIIFITLSLFLFCAETLPQYQNNGCREEYTFDFNTGNSTMRLVPNYQNEFFLLESVCVIFFTVEYFIRLFSCPNKKKFLRGAMNAMDIGSVLPSYISLLMALITDQCETNESAVIKVSRILRAFRIFKFSKHSQVLRIWMIALKASAKEFFVFLFFIMVSGVLFASLLYVAEQFNSETQIKNIPEGIWWAIASMTTVGYGDIVPTSFWGKLAASTCVVSGVIAVALPTPIIVANFSRFYRNVTGRGHDEDM